MVNITDVKQILQFAIDAEIKVFLDGGWGDVYKRQSLARDENAGYLSWGHSLLVSPWGDIMAQMDEREGCLINEIDLDYVEKIRRELPLLKARRTDIYQWS